MMKEPTKILTKSQLSTITATTAARNPNGPRNIVNAAAYFSEKFSGDVGTWGTYPKKTVAPTIPADVMRAVIAAE